MHAPTDPEPLARTYVDRLNAHDGAGVAALFAPRGTFEDPATGGPVAAADVAETIARVSAMLSPVYEVRHLDALGARVHLAWRMRGRNTAPLRPGFEPTRRDFEIDGVDVLEIVEGRIASVRRHFDRQALAERIGLQVIVEPFEQEGAEFGHSMHVGSGHRGPPGVVALTWIRARDEAEKETIRGHSRQIVRDFRSTPGFIGIVTGFAGLRGFTVTAWESEEALGQGIARHHASAKQAFRTTDLSPGVWTSVWKPLRINRIWTRCTECQHANDVSADLRACERCGAELPPRPTFW
jgi:hypothetical protein